MNPDTRQQKWKDILQLSEQLKDLFAGEDWVELNKLAVKRQNLLRDFFAMPVPEAEVAEMAEEIQKVMHDDAQLLAQGRDKQAGLIKEVQKITTNRDAINAYQSIQK